MAVSTRPAWRVVVARVCALRTVLHGAMRRTRGARRLARTATLLAIALVPHPAPAQPAPTAVTLVPRLVLPVTGLDRCENHYSTNTGGNKPDEFLLPGFGQCWTTRVGFVEVWVERPPAESCRRIPQTAGVFTVTTFQGAHACAHVETATCPLGYLPINSNTGCLQLGAVLEKQPPACPTCGNPINFASGEKSQRESDYRGAGAAPLVFERYYSSRVTMPLAHLGPGWRHGYDLSLVVSGNGVSEAAYARRPDGRVLGFANAADPLVWRADPDVTHRLYSVLDAQGQRVGFRLLGPDDTEERYDAQGRIASITPRGGHTLSVENDALGRPVRVSDPFAPGRALAFEYGAGGRLAAVIDPAGGRIEYGYDAQGRLSSVRYPDDTPADPADDPVRVYHYENPALPLHLTGISDENGVRFASWAYDASGRAVVSEHAGGAERIEVLYQADGSVQTTDALRRVHRYTLGTQFGVRRVLADADGVCDGCGGASATTYDASGFVASRTDRNGNVTRYVHDARGLELSRTEAAGTALERTVTTQWHPQYRVPVRIEVPGQVATFDYDAAGRLLSRSVTDPASGRSRTTTTTYTADGLPASVDGPRTDVADVTTFDHAGGDLVRVTNALGHATNVTAYDAHGRALEVVDPNGLVTRFAYDARGRLVERTVDGRVTTYARDAVGQVPRTTLPDGSFAAYTYDAAGRLVAIEDALGNRIEYDLDAAGNRVAERVLDAAGVVARTRSRAFDALGRLVRETGGEGQVQEHAYDAAGNLTARTDGRGNRTEYRHDALERLESVTDALGDVTRHAYDARDNLVAVTPPNGLATTYLYDGLDDARGEHSPDRGVLAYDTDAAGHRIASTDARGVTAQLGYDALGRVLSVRYPDPGQDVAYAWDTAPNGIGRLASVRDAAGETAYAYDVRGNLVTETRTLAGERFTVAYGYDAADRIERITYPSGMQVRYARDAAGRVAAVERVDTDGTVHGLAGGIEYEPFGPARGLTLGNGLDVARAFDRDGRLTSVSTPGVLARAYQYDAGDNVAHVDDLAEPAASQHFGYDALDRLTAASGLYGALDFAYDAIGNRTARGGPAGLDSYIYDTASNRLLGIAGPNAQSFAYDDAGNTIARGAHGYAYDDAGRLAQASVAGTPQADYLYNAAGERSVKTTALGTARFVFGPGGELLARSGHDGALEETVYLDGQPLARITSGGAAATPGGVIELTYDDWRSDGAGGSVLVPGVRARVDLDSGALSVSEGGQVTYQDTLGLWYVREPMTVFGEPHELTFLGRFAAGATTWVQVMHHLPSGTVSATVWVDAQAPDGTRIARNLAPDELVALEETSGGPAAATTVRYHHLDHLGTPQALTDEAGRVVWQAHYLPFGEVIETVADDEQPLRFPGQFADDEVGGYYNYQRWYDAGTGRYWTSDPIGLEGGLNTYLYTDANPIRKIDPFGLAATGLSSGICESLRRLVNETCKTATSCSGSDSCHQLRRKIEVKWTCIRAQTLLTYVCFRGSESHRQRIADEVRGIRRCQRLLVKNGCEQCS